MSIRKIKTLRNQKGLIKKELIYIRALYNKRFSADEAYRKYPGISNIIAYEREWRIYPLVLDFLDKKSENYDLKNLEKDIYLDVIRPFLNKIPKGSDVIDAGGGIGRFAIEIAKMGHRVHIVDSSKTALKKASGHLRDKNLSNFKLHWAEASRLPMFADNTFDAALAIELACYSGNPDKIIEELARVTKKNGIIIISVEGKYGAMFSDANVSLGRIPEILRHDLLHIKNHLYVRYYTPSSLERLLGKYGIEVTGIFGSHYVTDGVLHKLIDVDKLGNKKYREDVLKIEKSFRSDPALKNLARAWIAVGRKR